MREIGEGTHPLRIGYNYKEGMSPFDEKERKYGSKKREI
jgi:hypothetical protein